MGNEEKRKEPKVLVRSVMSLYEGVTVDSELSEVKVWMHQGSVISQDRKIHGENNV